MRKIIVDVPEGVAIEVEKGDDRVKVKVKGPKGEVERELKGKNIEVEVKGNNVDVSCEQKEMINTALSHIRNMIKGVTEGFERKMVVRYSHFPMNLEVKGNKLIIKNFLGERESREAKIVGNSKVSVKGQELVVSGPNIEEVSQTVANIRQATKIKKKDLRVFQDGIYPAN